MQANDTIPQDILSIDGVATQVPEQGRQTQKSKRRKTGAGKEARGAQKQETIPKRFVQFVWFNWNILK